MGANLHYLNPALRGQLASSLINKKQVDFSIGYSKLIHSYFPGNMGDIYAVPVDGNEWNDVAKLVTESFVDKIGNYVEPQAAGIASNVRKHKCQYSNNTRFSRNH